MQIFCRKLQEISHFSEKIMILCFLMLLSHNIPTIFCVFVSFLPYFSCWHTNYHDNMHLCNCGIVELCIVDLVWMLLFMFMPFMYFSPERPAIMKMQKTFPECHKKHLEVHLAETSSTPIPKKIHQKSYIHLWLQIQRKFQ